MHANERNFLTVLLEGKGGKENREFTIRRKFVSLHAYKPRLRDPLLTIMELFIVPNTMTGLFLVEEKGEGSLSGAREPCLEK